MDLLIMKLLIILKFKHHEKIRATLGLYIRIIMWESKKLI